MNTIDRAIWNYASERFAALSRKVKYRLQRINASGIYGDDCECKTLWDEFCYEVAEGPTDVLESAWCLTLRPFLESAVSTLSVPEKKLLFLATEAGLENDDESTEELPIDDDALMSKLFEHLRELATAHRGGR